MQGHFFWILLTTNLFRKTIHHRGVFSYFRWHLHPEHLKYLRFFSCSSNPLCCSFVIYFVFVLAWFLISALSLRYFSTSCNTLWNSISEISLSYIACEIISAILSSLLWARSLLAYVNVLKDFCVISVAREKIRLLPFNAIPTSRSTPPINEAIETHSVITLDVTSLGDPPLGILVVSNRFIFFVNLFWTSISSSNLASFSNDIFVDFA